MVVLNGIHLDSTWKLVEALGETWLENVFGDQILGADVVDKAGHIVKNYQEHCQLEIERTKYVREKA